MRQSVREYLATHRVGEVTQEFTDEESLLEAGVIDSLAMVDLIADLERTFGISVDEDDMTPENFDSVNAIVAYLERKRQSPGCTAMPSVSAT